MTPLQTGSPPRKGEGLNLRQQTSPSKTTNSETNLTDLSASAQRNRLLGALRSGPVSTLSARRDLAVMHPGMRILELRRAGFSIDMVWHREPDGLGVVHRQAQYFLRKEAAHGH